MGYARETVLAEPIFNLRTSKLGASGPELGLTRNMTGAAFCEFREDESSARSQRS